LFKCFTGRGCNLVKSRTRPARAIGQDGSGCCGGPGTVGEAELQFSENGTFFPEPAVPVIFFRKGLFLVAQLCPTQHIPWHSAIIGYRREAGDSALESHDRGRHNGTRDRASRRAEATDPVQKVCPLYHGSLQTLGLQTLGLQWPTRARWVRGWGRCRSALVPMIGCGYPNLGYAISASEVPCGSHTSPVLIFGWLRSSRSLEAAWGHKPRARCDQAAICGCSDQPQR
jgi:hypothetical protein